MKDTLGREIDYIRISVTDRCNLRCVYCMPKEGIPLVSHKDILSFDEMERLCGIFSDIGIKKIKLTGGEPLVRQDLAELVKKFKSVRGIESVTLTTNGVLLPAQMKALGAAGLDGVNISLDTMDPNRYAQITRSSVERFADVQRGIESALAEPKMVVKINCVPLSQEAEPLVEMALLARDRRLHVRFIEMMPIGYGKNYRFLGEREIRHLLEDHIGFLTEYGQPLGNGPGHYYLAEGFKGSIGFISAMSHGFCASCNRIRLSAAGYLKTCLQYEQGCDLKILLRNGSTDAEVKQRIKNAIRQKPLSHHFLDSYVELEEQKAMSQIGG